MTEGMSSRVSSRLSALRSLCTMLWLYRYAGSGGCSEQSSALRNGLQSAAACQCSPPHTAPAGSPAVSAAVLRPGACQLVSRKQGQQACWVMGSLWCVERSDLSRAVRTVPHESRDRQAAKCLGAHGLTESCAACGMVT